MRVRNGVDGPSSGASFVGDEMRDVADARDDKVGTEAFWESREAVDARVVVRPGIIMRIYNVKTSLAIAATDCE